MSVCDTSVCLCHTCANTCRQCADGEWSRHVLLEAALLPQGCGAGRSREEMSRDGTQKYIERPWRGWEEPLAVGKGSGDVWEDPEPPARMVVVRVGSVEMPFARAGGATQPLPWPGASLGLHVSLEVL